MTSKATPRDTTTTSTSSPTTTTTTRFLNMPRALTLLLLLATVLPPPSSSSPLSLPSSSSSSALSSSSLAKRVPGPPAETDCNNDLEVSAICFNCAALTPKDFHTIHSRCCLRDGPVRDLCVGWYTEEPKKGRRLKYF